MSDIQPVLFSSSPLSSLPCSPVPSADESDDVLVSSTRPAIEIDPERSYTRTERLKLEIAQHHVKKEANLKPNILNIAGTFEISKSTLYRHIRNPKLNDHNSAEFTDHFDTG
jgi:hypothetical protein